MNILILYILTVAQSRTELLPVSNPTSVQGENVNIGGSQTVVARDNVGGNQTNIETQVVNISIAEGAEGRCKWKFQSIKIPGMKISLYRI